MKFTGLLDIPPAITTIPPFVVPSGTGTVIDVELQLEGVAAIPLKLTVPGLDPNPDPEIVTVAPIAPV